MSFSTALSGMRAANKELDVTGNNIANVGTVGFKQSRAEFADAYASSFLGTGSSSTQKSSGVRLSTVSQLFNQGNISSTDNALDLAINGSGFFQVSNNGVMAYTRAGYFGLDNQGYIIDNQGYNLQGYTVDAQGNLQNGVIGDLQIVTDGLAPQPTTSIDQVFNLNSSMSVPTVTTFSADDPASYNSSTSVNIYDSQGNVHVMRQYFVKTDANTWDMHILIDGRNPSDPTATTPYTLSMDFSTNGGLNTITSTTDGITINPDTKMVSLTNWTPAAETNTLDANGDRVWRANGAAANPTGISMDFTEAAQFATTFSVDSLSQDGYGASAFSGLEIDSDGMIYSRYTNGQLTVQGQVILSDFINPQGLTPLGDSLWAESMDSGQPVRNPPGFGTLGAIQSAALEDSNVDLSEQLVDLIVAQRNYQANAKTIETESSITQTIIGLR